MSLEHSWQGKRATKSLQPFTVEEFLLRIAFISAWQTKTKYKCVQSEQTNKQTQ